MWRKLWMTEWRVYWQHNMHGEMGGEGRRREKLLLCD